MIAYIQEKFIFNERGKFNKPEIMRTVGMLPTKPLERGSTT